MLYHLKFGKRKSVFAVAYVPARLAQVVVYLRNVVVRYKDVQFALLVLPKLSHGVGVVLRGVALFNLMPLLETARRLLGRLRRRG